MTGPPATPAPSMVFPFGTPMTLMSRSVTGVDSDGNDVYTVTPLALVGVFAPGGSTELTTGRDTVISNDTVYLPTGTVVQPTDTIQIGTALYKIQGMPSVWSSPFSAWAPGVAVPLQLVSG